MRPSRFISAPQTAAKTAGLAAAGLGLILALWAVASGLGWLKANVFPSPWTIASALHDDGPSFYLSVASTTGSTALTGLGIGVGTGLACVVIAALVPRTQAGLVQVALVLQCLPSMAIGPILALLAGGRVPGIVIGAVAVHYAVLIPTLAGLRSVSQAQLEVVRVYGGSRLKELLKVRAFAALPAFTASLQIAVPCAVIGALLGEYLGGVDKGIGVAMAVSQGVYEKTRTWNLGLLTVALTLAGTGVAAALRAAVNRRLT
ncbi:MAG: ABC transporter permease subunit [Bifidobacteriaceae bacterium]|jgi:ABC-type nitrate/sulfonate/bicarbonate transport system permease component|nr:ABC transporter permease subunit [Bifidobacteriaceae bacterium]